MGRRLRFEPVLTTNLSDTAGVTVSSARILPSGASGWVQQWVASVCAVPRSCRRSCTPRRGRLHHSMPLNRQLAAPLQPCGRRPSHLSGRARPRRPRGGSRRRPPGPGSSQSWRARSTATATLGPSAARRRQAGRRIMGTRLGAAAGRHAGAQPARRSCVCAGRGGRQHSAQAHLKRQQHARHRVLLGQRRVAGQHLVALQGGRWGA